LYEFVDDGAYGFSGGFCAAPELFVVGLACILYRQTEQKKEKMFWSY